MRSRTLLVPALALALLAIPAAADAKEPSAAELSMAKDMLREAQAEAKKNNCADAIELLKQVIAIKETGEALMHLGECQAATGSLMEGLTTLERAEDLARQQKDKATQQSLVTKLDAMRARVPSIDLVIPPDVTDARVTLDGTRVPADKASRPIVVAPGEHTIQVEAVGKLPFTHKLTVAEKERVTVTVGFGTGPQAESGGPSDSAPPAADAPAGSPPIPLATWIGGSAAVVLAVGGVIAFVAAGSAASDGEEQCALAARCDEAAVDSVRQLDAAALGLWIGAGAGAAVAVTFYVLSRNEGPSAQPAASARVVVGPGSLRVLGTF